MRELNELLAIARTDGMDAGLYGLTDEFPMKLEARLKESALQLFGDVAAACGCLETRLAMLAAEHEETGAAISSYLCTRHIAVEPAGRSEWLKHAATVSLAFAGVALALEQIAGTILTYRLCLLLAFEAALLILNLHWILTLPGRSASRIREYIRYR